MRYHELVEAPINDLELHGDQDNEGSFRASDLRAIKNPSWQLKVKNAFSKTPFVFNVYLYNGEDGIVDFSTKDDYRHRLNTRELKHLSDKMGHGEIDPVLVRKLTGKNIQTQGCITAILFDNEGANRLPLTAWMLAHRISHAIEDTPLAEGFVSRVRSCVRDFDELFTDRPMRGDRESFTRVAKAFGKMRSAQSGALEASPGEFIVELMAQYLIQGSISFNTPDVEIFYSNKNQGRSFAKTKEMMDSDIAYHTEILNKRAASMLKMCEGRCFGI